MASCVNWIIEWQLENPSCDKCTESTYSTHFNASYVERDRTTFIAAHTVGMFLWSCSAVALTLQNMGCAHEYNYV